MSRELITLLINLAVEASAFVCTQNGAMPIMPKELLEKARL